MRLAGGDFYVSGTFWVSVVGVIVAVIGAVAVVRATIVIGRPKRRLLYWMPKAAPLLNAEGEASRNLQVRWGDRVVGDPHVAEIGLFNQGSQAISADDFGEGLPLRLDVGVPIIGVLKSSTTPKSRPIPDRTVADVLEIGPGLIGSRQTVMFSVLVDGTPSRLTCAPAAIKDVEVSRRDSTYDRLRHFISIRQGRPAAPVVAAVFLALFLGAGLGYIARQARHAPRSISHPTSPSQPASTRPPVVAGPALQDPAGTGVAGVAYSPGGTVLAVGDRNGSTYLWSVKAAKAALTSPALRNPNGQAVFAVAFSPGGAMLAAGTINSSFTSGSIYLWDIKTRTLITAAPLHDPGSKGVNGVAFSPDGSVLAAADDNGSTYLWDVRTRKLIHALPDPGSGGVTGVAFSPAGTTLAASDNNGSTYLWDAAAHTITATLPDPGSKNVNAVAFGPDGSALTAADTNGNAYLWNVKTRTITRTLSCPGGQGAYGVAFDPGSSGLAVTCDNGRHTKSSIRVWATARERPHTVHDQGSQGAFRLAFSPDGSTLAVGDANARCYLWNITGLSS